MTRQLRPVSTDFYPLPKPELLPLLTGRVTALRTLGFDAEAEKEAVLNEEHKAENERRRADWRRANRWARDDYERALWAWEHLPKNERLEVCVLCETPSNAEDLIVTLATSQLNGFTRYGLTCPSCVNSGEYDFNPLYYDTEAD